MARRDGTVRRHTPARRPAILAGTAAAAIAAAWLWQARPATDLPSGDGSVRIVSGEDAARGLPAAAALATGIGIALHAVHPGDGADDATATLSHDGLRPRVVRLGEPVAPAITLTAIGPDHVDLTENGATTRLYLLASPGAGSPRRGLDPEPGAPSGELPAAALIARMQAAGGTRVTRTPEEIEGGR